jgi:FkbM family methyltransferase
MNFKEFLKKSLKKLLYKRLNNILIIIYLLIKNFNENLPNLILKRKYKIYDSKKIFLFSVRALGGSTIARGKSFFSREPETIDWINNFKKNSFFLDIGANIGIYSLYAGVKNHRVISIEPESANFFSLNLNIADNELENNIKSYPYSIDNSNKISNLFLRTSKIGGSGNSVNEAISDDEKVFNPVYVQGTITITVDKLINQLKIKPNYIKIDTDGNELNIVKGMEHCLKNKKLLSVLIEINPIIKNYKKIINIFNKNGFDIKKRSIHSNNIIFGR